MDTTRTAKAWREEALCAQTDPAIFHPDVGGRGVVNAAAKRVCAACPVREPCLDWALSVREKWGIYGGLSEHERRPLLRERYGGAVA